MGFSKSKTTGAVNTAVVYKGGRRWIGPDRTFKIFDASAHDITLDDISVFAATDQVIIPLALLLVIFRDVECDQNGFYS